MKLLSCVLGMLWLLAWAVPAEDSVIPSIDQAGKITFNEVSGATGYRVEWAPVVAGPWTNFAAAAAVLDGLPYTGSGMVTCAVPMVYRVVATATNPPTATAIPTATATAAPTPMPTPTPTATPPPIPEDLVLMPAGSFVMGNATNVFPASEGYYDERPQHTVSVGAFYMGKFEVTKTQWDAVYLWATNNGYNFDNVGSGKAADHPVQKVSWYDAVKWCNAYSEKDGRTPCYTVSGSVYRTGTHSAVACDWTARGYRLPAEAEWEYAARGGVANHRFTWSGGDTIDHSLALYFGYPSAYAYDLGYEGYDTNYMAGAYPYTSPVGSFAGNGYGLRDMAGNVWEWCWDWYDGNYYSTSPGTDPRGPATGSRRVNRGGGWYDYADHHRVAHRAGSLPDGKRTELGFRVVLPPGQQGEPGK